LDRPRPAARALDRLRRLPFFTDERGFTLLEVLLVMIIIGTLAATAFAAFLGQRTKASDAEAKDNTAALALEVASCHVDRDDYTRCDEGSDLGVTGLPIDTGVAPDSDCEATLPTPTLPGDRKLAVVESEADCYVIEAVSPDGHVFWQKQKRGDPPERGCAPAGQGGCAVGAGGIGIWTKG
jgi:prepilin-type N-terminal cleavage/methylation domain-containing protein